MIVTEKRLVQWDTDKKVQVSSEEEFNEVHFYNKFSASAEVVLPKEGYADIPNHFLQTGDEITVWLVNSTEEGDTSIEKAVLEVLPRKKPADYVYTETEVITFKKLVEEVDKAVDNANAIAKDLEEKRDSGYFKGENGKDGINGVDGKDGKDGAPGPQGPQGIPGKDGAQGPKGDKGDKGEPGANGTNGTNGTNGKDGIDGKDGVDGKTPVKGVDYYTDAEKQDLIAEITESVTGDIDVALDNIIAIQNELIGGDSV
jgi:predicted RNA-binding protein with RPS1 domain